MLLTYLIPSCHFQIADSPVLAAALAHLFLDASEKSNQAQGPNIASQGNTSSCGLEADGKGIAEEICSSPSPGTTTNGEVVLFCREGPKDAYVFKGR